MILSYRYELNFIGGAIFIVFGQFMLGMTRLAVMERDFRFHFAIPGGKPFSAYILGLAFGSGWTPCVGPILSAILTTSAASAPMAEGVTLLGIYSAGLGVRSLLATTFTDRLTRRNESMPAAGSANAATQ